MDPQHVVMHLKKCVNTFAIVLAGKRQGFPGTDETKTSARAIGATIT